MFKLVFIHIPIIACQVFFRSTVTFVVAATQYWQLILLTSTIRIVFLPKIRFRTSISGNTSRKCVEPKIDFGNNPGC